MRNASINDLVNLFLAANYLDIPFILNGAAAVLADRLIKGSNPEELLKNIKILADKTAPNDAQGAAKRYFNENEKKIVIRITRDLLPYIMRHIAHRQYSLTEEYSIADYIREHGQRELDVEESYYEGKLRLNLEKKKLTSLFGIQLIKQETIKSIYVLALGENCFFNFSLDPQGVEKPFVGFTNLMILELDRNELVQLNPQLFTGLAF